MPGEALRGVPRYEFHISFKVSPVDENAFVDADQVRKRVKQSLRKLCIDTMDIFFFHKVRLDCHEATMQRFMPTVENLCDQGKIRHIGISETSNHEPVFSHRQTDRPCLRRGIRKNGS